MEVKLEAVNDVEENSTSSSNLQVGRYKDLQQFA